MFIEDDDLLFDPEAHKYTLRSDPTIPLQSVTNYIHTHSGGFDPDATSTRISKRDGVSRWSLLHKWALAGEESRELGTAVHAYAEATVLAGRPLNHPSCGHETAVDAFFTDHVSLLSLPRQSEARVADREWKLAGSIDLLCTINGELSVVDFKTSHTIDFFGFTGTKMKPPYHKWPDCNGSHYRLQLELYYAILSRQYKIHPTQLVLVHLLPGGSYRVYYFNTFVLASDMSI